MKVLIVSGGIGSGKSTVCRMLESDYGFPVYEADRRVKELYHEHPSLLSDIEDSFGLSFRDAKGVFQPSLMAARIFSDPEALQKVESMVFPVLTEDFADWKHMNADKEYAVLESATILEKPALTGLGDVVIVVDAPLEQRIERAVARDGISADKVLDRIRTQKMMNSISAGEIPAEVDYVLKNDGSLPELSGSLHELVDNLIVK